MALGPIPRSKIREYATLEMGLTDEAHDRFCLIIQQIDGEYLLMSRPQAGEDETPMRSIVRGTDTKGMGELVDRLGKKPSKPPHQKPKALKR